MSLLECCFEADRGKNVSRVGNSKYTIKNIVVDT